MREVGGAMLPVWPKFYENCHAVAFVADVSTAAALSGALAEWYNLLGEVPPSRWQRMLGSAQPLCPAGRHSFARSVCC